MREAALPSVEDNETLARRSYDAGELGLLDYLTIRRDALQVRTAVIDRRLEAAQRRIDHRLHCRSAAMTARLVASLRVHASASPPPATVQPQPGRTTPGHGGALPTDTPRGRGERDPSRRGHGARPAHQHRAGGGASGAQQVSVLGQMAADESRYAQVAPPTEGQVLQVLAELNAQVRAGTPLARLRSAELGRARAERLTADARRDLAAQTLERKRTLAAERIVAAREVQEAEAAFRAADAEARAAAAQAAGARRRRRRGRPTTRRRSCSGRRLPAASSIARRCSASTPDPATPLFTVADLSRVWLVAQAFERDAVTVEAGTVGAHHHGGAARAASSTAA